MSPNFGLANRAVQFLLDLPGVRHWGRFVAGKTRNFEPISEEHSAYWTTSYPSQAVSTMADAVRAVRQADLSAIQTPALFAFNEADRVVRADDTRAVMARWGGPVATHLLLRGAGDDAYGHVMAGDIFSPAQTGPLARRISAWLAELDSERPLAMPR
uniref:Alpha/beta hydrolase n=1 Tax=Yoonia rhodophyticola TaxID=3137370 RepID=A0AAN0MDW6_9RHOB